MKHIKLMLQATIVSIGKHYLQAIIGDPALNPISSISIEHSLIRIHNDEYNGKINDPVLIQATTPLALLQHPDRWHIDSITKNT